MQFRRIKRMYIWTMNKFQFQWRIFDEEFFSAIVSKLNITQLGFFFKQDFKRRKLTLLKLRKRSTRIEVSQVVYFNNK